MAKNPAYTADYTKLGLKMEANGKKVVEVLKRTVGVEELTGHWVEENISFDLGREPTEEDKIVLMRSGIEIQSVKVNGEDSYTIYCKIFRMIEHDFDEISAPYRYGTCP